MKNYNKMMKDMNSACKGMEKFMSSEWTTRDKSMIVAIAFLMGIIIGFVMSPIKNGVFSNNNVGSGNSSLGIEDEKNKACIAR